MKITCSHCQAVCHGDTKADALGLLQVHAMAAHPERAYVVYSEESEQTFIGRGLLNFICGI